MPLLQKAKTPAFVLAWLVLAAFVVYFVFFDGWRDATLGRFHRKAQEGARTDGITEARIYLLMGDKSQETSETFPIRPYGRRDPICGTVTLSGKELEEFLETWQWQEVSYSRQALCHDPAYGFRLYRGNRLAFETSLCWHCNNFWVEVWPLGASWYGFNADTKQAHELLELCDKLLPYRRPPPKEPRTSQQDNPTD